MRLRIRRPVQFQNTKPSLATAGEQQIFSCFNFISSNFYWCHILRGKADGMHLKNHLLRRRRFSDFFRQDLTRDMIRKMIKLHRPTELLLWVSWSINGSIKSKISRIHAGELNQFLAYAIFFKESTWWLMRKNCFFFFFFFFVTSKHSRQKIWSHTFDHFRQNKGRWRLPILCFSIALTGEPHQRFSMVRKSRSALKT